MNVKEIRKTIEGGKAVLGIEFGSTRIKAVLIGSDHSPIAQGDHAWENRLEGGVWTYHMDDVWSGLQAAYRDLAVDVKKRYGCRLTGFAAIGFSAMMHGLLAFDGDGKLLVPFRTWRNTMTEQAAADLSKAFSFNIPQRWSIAHLYEAVLKKEPFVPRVRFFTTLAGYIHWRLTGRKVLGVGDASGMFPIDSRTGGYDRKMMRKFDALVAKRHEAWRLADILPEVLMAGADAGTLTPEGAKLLDPSGALRPGCPLAPPEGDAGTGMAATNAVAVRTGNVSAGTSVFAMIVLERALRHAYPEIDMVTTPTGKAVAMVHCNNCTSDLNAWVSLLGEAAGAMGGRTDKAALYDTLYAKALTGDADCGGIAACNYFSGEPITKFDAGRPLVVRLPDAKFTLANFMRAHLYSAIATLKLGMDILTGKEHVAVDRLMGHGGLFKTKGVAQGLMAGALDVPVTCLETAGEGGPWGMALLAAYRAEKKPGETLEAFLAKRVFAGSKGATMKPAKAVVKGFARYLDAYRAALGAERAAVADFKETK